MKDSPAVMFVDEIERNIQKGYLQGRFGAIPFLGELNNLITVHEPEEQGV
jgi:hypothetical protein